MENIMNSLVLADHRIVIIRVNKGPLLCGDMLYEKVAFIGESLTREITPRTRLTKIFLDDKF